MCENPGLMWIKGGTQISVPCRKCWLCIETKVDDWVGRCIAESHTAAATRSITLTYGRDEHGNADHMRAAVLTYSDVQKYIKLLRRHGYPCRYLAVGEYGTEKGRAHWHLILFFQNEVPKHILAPPSEEREDDSEFRFMERHWPHGWSFWEECSAASIRYVCKYINKGMGDAERQGHVALSKKPPLGHQYFQDLAQRYVNQGVAPLEPYYWFSDVRKYKFEGDPGTPIKFYMRGVTLDNFCRAFMLKWWKAHNCHPPHSQMVEDFCDRMAKVDKPLLAEVMPRQVDPFYMSPGEAKSYYGEGKYTWQKKEETDGEKRQAWTELAAPSGAERYTRFKTGEPTT